MLFMPRPKGARKTHGHCYFDGKKQQSRTYTSWMSMHRRCCDPKTDSYPHYGGRGISVCERWDSFENFLEDMGECPDGFSIERKDVNGDYNLENCTWVLLEEQAFNRSNSVLLDIDGQKMLMTHAARIAGISPSSMSIRIRSGVKGRDLLKPGRKWELLTINGESKTAKEWAKIHGIRYVTLLERIKKGLPQDQWFKSTGRKRKAQ